MAVFKDQEDQPKKDIIFGIVVLGVMFLINCFTSGIFNFAFNAVFLFIAIKLGSTQVDKAFSLYSDMLGGKGLIFSSLLYGMILVWSIFQIHKFFITL